MSVDAVREQLANTYLRSAVLSDIPLVELDTDPVAANILADAGRAVGEVVTAGCNWLNPKAIILGGELGVSGSNFLNGFREAVSRLAVAACAESVTVLQAVNGERAELVGAVAMATEKAEHRSRA